MLSQALFSASPSCAQGALGMALNAMRGLSSSACVLQQGRCSGGTVVTSARVCAVSQSLRLQMHNGGLNYIPMHAVRQICALDG